MKPRCTETRTSTTTHLQRHDIFVRDDLGEARVVLAQGCHGVLIGLQVLYERCWRNRRAVWVHGKARV